MLLERGEDHDGLDREAVGASAGVNAGMMAVDITCRVYPPCTP